MQPVKIGVIGCGNISGIYFKNLHLFRNTQIVACSDLIPERSQAKAEQYPGVRACTNDELLADPEIQIVVNLTTPDAHFEVCHLALQAGKSVHVEKPLSITREQGQTLVRLAREKTCAWEALPTRFWAAAYRRAANSLMMAGSANRSARRPLCCVTVTSPGIPIPAFTTRWAAGRCSIWGRTI